MDALGHCRDKAAPPGSDLYYAGLYLPEDQQQALYNLHAFGVSLEEVIKRCTDPGVARIKLQWWKEELGRVYAGNPRHPIGVGLAATVERFGIPLQDLVSMVDGVDREFSQPGHPDGQALQAHLEATHGTLWRLSVATTGYSDPGTLEYCRALGGGLGLALLILGLREDAAGGRFRLALEELLDHGLSLEDIRSPAVNTTSVRDFIQMQVGHAAACLAEAEAQLPEVDRLAQLSGQIMSALCSAWLAEVAKDGYKLAEHRVVLTPLRKVWIARGIRRRERKRRGRASMP